MGYWDATDQYLSSHGGCAPTCSSCGKKMFSQDDHGRFTCFCNLDGGLDVVTGMRIRIKTWLCQVFLFSFQFWAFGRIFNQPAEGFNLLAKFVSFFKILFFTIFFTLFNQFQDRRRNLFDFNFTKV